MKQPLIVNQVAVGWEGVNNESQRGSKKVLVRKENLSRASPLLTPLILYFGTKSSGHVDPRN